MEKKVRKPGGHYYKKDGYSKGVLIFLKKTTHKKLIRLAKLEGETLQATIRKILEHN